MSAATFLVGDVFARMAELPDHSFDLIITSPPFLALRSYLPDGHPDKHLEIGSEATPAEFLDTMLALTAEWRRLLAPHGSIAIEIGDTYAGSGGAGGDYNPDGLRDGQPKFRQMGTREHRPPGARPDGGGGTGGQRERVMSNTTPLNAGPGWPLDKSLCGIPTLYTWSLAYGRNLLTGQPSPAGQWRIRNLKPWIRSNPPVGALGDKERPATSYITVACVGRDRWFDLDAVRTASAEAPRTVTVGAASASRGIAGGDSGNPDKERASHNPAGAPPLDWNVDADLVIDTEIDNRAREPARHATPPLKHGKAIKDNYDAPNIGARGVHIRRALQKAGILPGLDAYDISPRGYAGSHYAVFPKELVRRLIDEMCPRRVCVSCGEPSRRIVTKANDADERHQLAKHIRAERQARGLSIKDVAAWFPSRTGGLTGCVSNWETAANVPMAEQWLTLANRLGLDRERFDDLVLGDRRWTESTAEYFGQNGQRADKSDRIAGDFQGSGSAGKRDGGITATRKTLGWSDCGHNTWRPGRILDPFVGSGTTLAVATGMARTAVGIDLDPRNADLARDRVGMFLTIHEQEATDAS